MKSLTKLTFKGFQSIIEGYRYANKIAVVFIHVSFFYENKGNNVENCSLRTFFPSQINDETSGWLMTALGIKP